MSGDGKLNGTPDYIRASATIKEDLQQLYAQEARTCRAVENLKQVIGVIQLNLEQVTQEINKVKLASEESFLDMGTDISRLTESADKASREFRALAKIACSQEGAQRYQESLRNVLSTLTGIEGQLGALRTLLDATNLTLENVNDRMSDPAMHCKLGQVGDLDATFKKMNTMADAFLNLYPRMDTISKGRLEEMGYEPTEIKRLPQWDRFIDKIVKAITSNFFSILGMFLLGLIAWIIQSATAAKSDAKLQTVITKMEEAANQKDAEIANLQKAIQDLKKEKKTR